MTRIKSELNEALKAAMRARDRQQRDAIRLLQSAIKQVEIDQRGALDEAAILGILRREAKKRRETIAELESIGRGAAATGERAELAVIERFLPRQLAAEELRPLIEAAIAEAGATSMRDMGPVMRLVMPQVAGRADGKIVNSIVRELLS